MSTRAFAPAFEARFSGVRSSGPSLWLRWVAANAAGELVGLGLAALVGWALLAAPGEDTLFSHILTALALIAVGTFEGAVMGVAQWAVLRAQFPALGRMAWVEATALGALVAWGLGMLPSTLLGASAAGSGAPPPEMSDAMQMGLAALMGLVLGPILAIFQWRVLRRHVARAGWWIPANALAWAAGMPVVFLAAGSAPTGASVAVIVAFVAAALAAAGAVVGAIHGLCLVWLARAPRPG